MSDSETSASPIPTPGSREARDKGCRCPVVDNNYGKYPPAPPFGWWMREDCPLHGELPVLEQ